VRGTARCFKVDKNCVLAFAMKVGLGCLVLHNRLVRGLASLLIEGDETWSFIQKKQARIDPVKDPAEYGDAYTFIGLDAIAKLVISCHVGKRTEEDADIFARDLRSRLTMVPHLSTDGFNAYPAIIAKHFGGSVDYGTAVKHYTRGAVRGPDHRYEPPRDPFVTKHSVIGAPQDELICTAHVERYNLTQRHIVGRTRRLCLAFSKTLKGHVAGMALGVFAYNFVREHSALGKRRTPAMAAGLTDHPWTIAELVEAALAVAEEEPGDLPEAVPLAMPVSRGGKAVGASRPLPNGRGFLRAVAAPAPSAKGAPPPPSPPAPGEPPPAPAVTAVPDPAQLDLFSWKPRLPPPGTQLSLFGDAPEPPK
jgi:IS1 family transposase